MTIRHTVLALALLAGGCANFALYDTAQMPAGEFPGQPDPLTAALYEAQLALDGQVAPPTGAAKWARVAADVEYLSGQVNTNVRFIGTSVSATAEMKQAREELRGVLGVPMEAKSQDVVDALVAVSRATDTAGMRQAVRSPIFTLGPDATLGRLQAGLPLPRTVYALALTNRSLYDGSIVCRNC
jgi:hypothetical protein